jgi:hypothetical protein
MLAELRKSGQSRVAGGETSISEGANGHVRADLGEGRYVCFINTLRLAGKL